MTLRLHTGLFERIEAHQAKLEALAGGVRIARHDVLLMLLTKALDALDPPSPALSLPAMGPVSPPSALPQESVGSEPSSDPAVSPADPAPTGADTPAVPRKGRRPGPLRQQILDVLQAHPEGLPAEEIRVYVQAQRLIGDTLQGMVKGGVITAQGRGPARQYVVAE
jgi:hypothetical protein